MPGLERCMLLSLAVWIGTAGAVSAAEIEATSRIDSVTVYPDGATVTRIIRVDLSKGDATVLAGEVRTFRLGWRVRWPANREIAYDSVRP